MTNRWSPTKRQMIHALQASEGEREATICQLQAQIANLQQQIKELMEDMTDLRNEVFRCSNQHRENAMMKRALEEIAK
jgi:peptidoglycan hydrolase CwlO-like protein